MREIRTERRVNLRNTGFKGLCVFILFCVLSGLDPAPVLAFDHQYPRWGKVLEKYTVEGLVNYQRLKKAPEDLDGFLESINALSRSEYDQWRDKEKTAFWINVYNAAVLRIVSDYYPFVKRLDWRRFKYPRSSIQQIPNVWKQKFLGVFGQKFSLEEIEQKILMKEFKDPRIYFALTTASVSSPALRKFPYVPDLLNTVLDEQIGQFLENSQYFTYDASEDCVFLSQIFRWHKEDFDGKRGILEFVRKYAEPGIREKISDRTKIEWFEFDWTLNEK